MPSKSGAGGRCSTLYGQLQWWQPSNSSPGVLHLRGRAAGESEGGVAGPSSATEREVGEASEERSAAREKLRELPRGWLCRTPI